MKKIFTLAMMAVLGMGSAWADNPVTIQTNSSTFSASGDDYVATSGDVTLTYSKGGSTSAISGGIQSAHIRVYKNATFTISTTEKKIAKVEITTETSSSYDADGFAADDYKADGSTGTWQGTATNSITLTASNTQVRVKQVVVTFEDTDDTRTSTTITFAADPETRVLVNVPDMLKKKVPTAAVYAGETEVSNAVIVWSSNSDDVTIAADGTITATEQGTYTITATYAGNATYKEATKSYTLKAYKPYESLSSMVSDVTSGNEKWDTGELVFYMLFNHDTEATFTNTVAYVNGTSTYITDGTDFMLLYGISGLTTGDVITSAVDLEKGSVTGIYGNLYRYNKQLPEINLHAIDVTTTASGTKVDPVVITADKLGENLNHYVTIQDAEYVSADGDNLTFKVGETTFTVRKNWNNVSIEGLEATAKYTLEGMEAIYNTTNQLYLISWTKTSEPTGISTAKTAAEFNGAIYNIAGQKVSASYKGLVIKNGKKVVQK